MRNIRKLIFAFLYVAFSIGIAKAEGIKPFFWEMTDNSGKTSYLLGSIHLGIADMYPLPDGLLAAFDSSEVLVLEINMNEVNPVELMKKAMFQDERTLESSVSEAHFKYFETEFHNYGLNKSYYNKFKPWFAAFFVGTLNMQNEGLEQDLGIDMYFLGKANEREMQVDQLESMDSQVNIFESLDSSLTDYYIDYMLQSSKQDSSELDNLIKAFKSGDEKAIENLILGDDLSNDPNMKIISEKLIKDRNYKMADKIIEMHSKSQIHFIIAGAAHFVGDDGIISILQRNPKFKLERK